MNLNQKYTVKAQAGTISDEGKRQIGLLIARQSLTDGEWQLANPGTDRRFLPQLPADWLWVWEGKHGEYRGAFPKRVSQFYHKNYEVKLPWSFMTELGNLARQHSADDVTYTFEFTDRLDWQAGDFGDRGSCFWGDHSGAREMLVENDGMAVLFFNAHGGGIARAWAVAIEDELLIVFNGYGFPGDATLTIATIIASFREGSYRMIHLSNNGRDGGVLYFNGGRGFIIGPADLIASYTSYDFEWEEIYSYACRECGRGIADGEEMFGPDDMPYCERCYGELTSYCEQCDQTYWVDEISRYGDRYLCRWCAEQIEPPAREGK